jgi:MHS family shikimate/dehydroshikimate transporter-like MFS transporter
VAASTIGTVIEWCDFFVNASAAALVFGPLFFPASNPTVSTLAALSVYALGYVARPLGGIIFGHFGDRVGRKSMLVISMMLMGFGTFLVGLLPTYQQIGVLAPILLIVLRLLQAMGLGGEWGGAVLLVTESAPARRRGLFGSLCRSAIRSAALPRQVCLRSQRDCRRATFCPGDGVSRFLRARC